MLGFCGCLGLIVMLRSAVWMAHVYEDPVLYNPGTFDENIIVNNENGLGTADVYYGLANLSSSGFALDQNPVAVVFAPKASTSDFKDV
ncbi:uncharacterized protein ColSpa_11651 [Colletotrichum spaethianum]|uniref:Uncharacterized protein n=1 Tax=Colletotrichum spaethianum TaxID=700344 RepID=A0AA37PFQ9_9PEZI|nr:uncharacterized protein ColSpa_11651 [Colletotrichum spaethianum]GKT51470.1 hypothetical protein ColSpa_11651 [Colletotrichum spaethianum]